MWMEFTPKDWLMVRVGLIFREGDPDGELTRLLATMSPPAAANASS
jgi:hypothetical protein